MTMVLENISKRYGAVVAIRQAALSLKAGEVRALYGGNGSGKSKLAKIMAGLLRSDSGHITIDGTEMSSTHLRQARAGGVGITFQELSLFPQLTVAENLAFSAMPERFGFRSDRRIDEQAVDILKRLRLDHLVSLPVTALQVGEKYLVEFAKLLLARPRYMILDELTSALHDNEAAIVHQIIAEHRRGGGSVIFVSHRIREILAICDTITVMKNGEAVAQEEIGQVSEHKLVAWAGGSENLTQAKTVSSSVQPQTLLSVEGLDCGAGNLAFNVARGEILGLGGLPDQGQGRIIAALSGDRPSSSATILIDGSPAAIRRPADAVRQGIAYITGDRDEIGFRSLSILQNIEAAHINTASRTALATGVAKDALASLTTRYRHMQMPLSSLSGGNQQKVLLARAFVTNPRIVVAADPTKGIDVAAREEVHKALRRLAAEHGSCVILTSSDDSELAAVCDRVLVMEEGRVKSELSRADGSLTQDGLMNAYLHREEA
jgi:ABC-type sugar transport system ATPase subunit